MHHVRKRMIQVIKFPSLILHLFTPHHLKIIIFWGLLILLMLNVLWTINIWKSPGTENLRCLEVQKVLRTFQWINYSHWLRQEQAYLALNQTKCNQVKEFVLSKNRLTNILESKHYLVSVIRLDLVENQLFIQWFLHRICIMTWKVYHFQGLKLGTFYQMGWKKCQ